MIRSKIIALLLGLLLLLSAVGCGAGEENGRLLVEKNEINSIS